MHLFQAVIPSYLRLFVILKPNSKYTHKKLIMKFKQHSYSYDSENSATRAGRFVKGGFFSEDLKGHLQSFFKKFSDPPVILFFAYTGSKITLYLKLIRHLEGFQEAHFLLGYSTNCEQPHNFSSSITNGAQLKKHTEKLTATSVVKLRTTVTISSIRFINDKSGRKHWAIASPKKASWKDNICSRLAD